MKKKIVIISIGVLVTLMVVAIVSFGCMFHNQYAAAQSVEQVGDKMYQPNHNFGHSRAARQDCQC